MSPEMKTWLTILLCFMIFGILVLILWFLKLVLQRITLILEKLILILQELIFWSKSNYLILINLFIFFFFAYGGYIWLYDNFSRYKNTFLYLRISYLLLTLFVIFKIAIFFKLRKERKIEKWLDEVAPLSDSSFKKEIKATDKIKVIFKNFLRKNNTKIKICLKHGDFTSTLENTKCPFCIQVNNNKKKLDDDAEAVRKRSWR
jgi:hypothetical protein